MGLALWFGLILCGALMVFDIVAGALALYEKRTVFVMPTLHRDKSGARAVLGRLRAAINILFRLAIIGYLGFGLWTFSDIIWFYLHQLVLHIIDVFAPGATKLRPIALFTILGGSLVGPGHALAAIVLAAANKYLALAVLSIGVAYFFLVTSIG